MEEIAQISPIIINAFRVVFTGPFEDIIDGVDVIVGRESVLLRNNSDKPVNFEFPSIYREIDWFVLLPSHAAMAGVGEPPSWTKGRLLCKNFRPRLWLARLPENSSYAIVGSTVLPVLKWEFVPNESL